MHPKDVPVGVSVCPKLHRVALLLVNPPKDDIEKADEYESPDPPAFGGSEGLVFPRFPLHFHVKVRGQGVLAEQVDA